jgi:hypothetical protein
MKKSDSGAFSFDNKTFLLSYKESEYIKTDDILFSPLFVEMSAGIPYKIEKHKTGITYFFNNGPLERLEVYIDNRKTHFEIHSEAIVADAVTLTAWNIFGGASTIPGFNQIVVANLNTKGRLTTSVFDKMRIGDQYYEFTHTMGMGIPSWFFPLPVNYICATYHGMMFLGLDNVYDFSQWTLSVKDEIISKWTLEYGKHLKYKKGDVVKSPVWIGFFMDSDDPFEPWPVYTEILKNKGGAKITIHSARPGGPISIM